MRRPIHHSRIAPLAALLSLCILVTACGGGGGGAAGDGGFEALFVGDPILPSDIGMAAPAAFAGESLGSDFDVEIRVTGPFTDVLGAAFRVKLPLNVELTPPGFSDGDSFLRETPSPNGFNFSALQIDDEILVVATRLEGAEYVDGVDVADGDEKTLITLHLTVTAPPGGDLSLIPPREFDLCDDISETCGPVPDGSLIWGGGTLIAN